MENRECRPAVLHYTLFQAIWQTEMYKCKWYKQYIEDLSNNMGFKAVLEMKKKKLNQIEIIFNTK